MKESGIQSEKGFTMVELLMVLGMMAALMTAIYSIYRTQQRSAYVQDDVVEVQQNLRIALDSITRDVRMAALLVTAPNPPIVASSDNAGFGKSSTGVLLAAQSDSLTLNTVSSAATLAMARIEVFNKGQLITDPIIVDSADAVDRFVSGASGDVVRVLKPNQPKDLQTYRVIAKDRAVPSLTLTQLTGAPADPFKAGHLIVKVPLGVVPPCTVQYGITTNVGTPSFLQGAPSCPAGQLCLARSENGAAGDVIATNITDLQFRYIRELGPMAQNDIANPVPPSPAGDVRAVRITITGQTNASVGMSDNQVKTRTLTSVEQLKNKK